MSLLFYYRYGSNNILITGDITPEILSKVLNEDEGTEKRYTIFKKVKQPDQEDWHLFTSNQPSLKSIIQNGLSVLVAPHHGLESGFSKSLYTIFGQNKPDIVVISEKRHKSITDGKVDQNYQSFNGSLGLTIDIDGSVEKRNSITTRNGHHILIIFKGNGKPIVFCDKDPNNLLKKII